MTVDKKVRAYVTGVAIAALAVLGSSRVLSTHELDRWALATFLLIGCLLELSRTTGKQGGVTGSLVFVFHLSVGLVMGTFWGAATAGMAGAISQVYQRNTPLKVL